MDKLKTLKDLVIPIMNPDKPIDMISKRNGYIFDDELRQELGIKWLKELRKRPEDIPSGARWKFGEYHLGKIAILKEIFNITEKDLKKKLNVGFGDCEHRKSLCPCCAEKDSWAAPCNICQTKDNLQKVDDDGNLLCKNCSREFKESGAGYVI